MHQVQIAGSNPNYLGKYPASQTFFGRGFFARTRRWADPSDRQRRSFTPGTRQMAIAALPVHDPPRSLVRSWPGPVPREAYRCGRMNRRPSPGRLRTASSRGESSGSSSANVTIRVRAIPWCDTAQQIGRRPYGWRGHCPCGSRQSSCDRGPDGP